MREPDHMTKSRKKKRNKYQENRIKVLKKRIRKSLPIMAIFAGFCLILFLSAGLSRLYYALQDMPWLKVEEIEIAGLKKVERTRVLDTMGVSRGECILNLRMGLIADRIKQIPAVKSASVRLDMPGRIVVEIVEAEPLALMKGGESYYLMDENGTLFDRSLPETSRNLPIITGMCSPRLKEGDTIPGHNLSRVKELVSALNESRSWLPPSSVGECKWSLSGFTLVLGERGVPVEVGQESFFKKIARLKQIIATLDERRWTELVTSIDLDYSGKAYLGGTFPGPKPVAGQEKQSS